jgi:transcriptional regulator with XRE-family HTH domain
VRAPLDMRFVACKDEQVPPNQKLREARESIGMTREQLAHQAGVSVRSIAGYELEGRRPGMAIAERVAQALGCSIDDLFNGDAHGAS